ncbi:MAG: enoyl-CoA hydratase-related protein [Chitinophagales bacterium]
MSYEYLKVEQKENVQVILINRPDKMNALNRELIRELGEAIQEVYDNKELNGAVISGVGNKAFAAGADIAEFTGLTSVDARSLSEAGHRVFNKIENCPKPVIAAVNGFALGGGCELAMACHMRIAGETARFGQPEVNLGIVPGYGGTQRMAHLLGKGKAFELLMTADMINGQEAKAMGLVNKLGHNDSLVDSAIEIIQKIAAKAPLAIAGVINAINAAYTDGVNGYQTEIDEFANCASSQDFQEGASAFLEKRRANFKGE